MENLKDWLFHGFCLLAWMIWLPGFVFLSGVEEATLNPATAEEPEVTFQWDGSYPTLKRLEELRQGTLTGLSQQDAMEQVLLEAMAQWNGVPGSYVKLKLVKNLDAKIDSTDKVHTISVKKDANLTTAAYALPILENGSIVDCDVTISDRSVFAHDLVQTSTHELGHCLGLGHAHSNYGAIMGYARQGRSYQLGVDDKAGLIYLYPDPQESRGVQNALCGGRNLAQHQNSMAVIFLLPFVACLAVSRRKFLKSK